MKARVLPLGIAVAVLGVGLVLGGAATAGPTVQRPLSDFLENQSITWSNAWTNPDLTMFAYLDYTGRMAKELKDHAGIDLHTTIGGTVHERALPGGGAEVTVQLRVKNAFANAQLATLDSNGVPVSFVTTLGVTWLDVLNYYGLPWTEMLEGQLPYHAFPFALGDGILKWVYVTPRFGDTIPDMGRVLWAGEYPEITPILAHFEGTAVGPLWAAAGLGPDGTPGKMSIHQTLFINKAYMTNNPGTVLPVSIVTLRRIGK